MRPGSPAPSSWSHPGSSDATSSSGAGWTAGIGTTPAIVSEFRRYGGGEVRPCPGLTACSRALPRLAPGLAVPDGFVRLLGTKRTASSVPGGWLRNELEEESVRKGAWNLFVLDCLAVAATAVVACSPSLRPGHHALRPGPLTARPHHLLIPVPQRPGELRPGPRNGGCSREGPSTIGCMTMSMQVRSFAGTGRGVRIGARRRGPFPDD